MATEIASGFTPAVIRLWDKDKKLVATLDQQTGTWVEHNDD